MYRSLLDWLVTCLQTSGGYEVDRRNETEAAAGDGWDDADNWESFEEMTPKSSEKSPPVC